MKELTDINSMSISFVELITPMLATNFMNGLKFRMHSSFNEGDTCLLEGEKAIIVKIGFYETIIQIDNGRGTVWRYLPNDRIKFYKLEKMIKEPEKTTS